MSQSVLIGYFDSEERILAATRAARESGYNIHDVYTPYAVHGMDDAMGLRPSRLTWVTFLGGLTGLTAALSLQLYTSVVSWPIIVGGKPFNSFPAFIPVAFELTVLFAGLSTVAAFLARCTLFPGQKRVALPRVTDDRFALALQAEGEPADVAEAERTLQQLGAVETTKVEVAS
jgi:hypothetical protein